MTSKQTWPAEPMHSAISANVESRAACNDKPRDATGSAATDASNAEKANKGQRNGDDLNQERKHENVEQVYAGLSEFLGVVCFGAIYSRNIGSARLRPNRLFPPPEIQFQQRRRMCLHFFRLCTWLCLQLSAQIRVTCFLFHPLTIHC